MPSRTPRKHDDLDFPGFGFVEQILTYRQAVCNDWRRVRGLNAPWGVHWRRQISDFQHHLLIGNAGSGEIAVYDVNSGASMVSSATPADMHPKRPLVGTAFWQRSGSWTQ